MPNIHVYPDQLTAAVQSLKDDAVYQWGEQLKAYRSALHGVQAAPENWFGGRGRSGEVQEGSRQFLARFATELDRLRTEKEAFIQSFTTYLDCLANLAHGVREADNAARDTLNKIADGFTGPGEDR